MTAIYNVMELATALKPFLLRHLLAAGAPSVTYLDPDIEVFAPLDDIAGGGRAARHRAHAAPADPGARRRPPARRAGLRSCRAPTTSASWPWGRPAAGFLDWWAERCRRDCLHDVPDGLFVDQRWVDLAAAYFPPLVLRDPGLNVAYWNVDERPIEPAPGGGHRAGGCAAAVPPLQRLRPRRRPPAHPLPRGAAPGAAVRGARRCATLCAAYGERLRAEGWDECRKLDYGLAFAANGMVLDGLMRRIVRQELLRRERTLEHDVGDVDGVPDPYEPDEVDGVRGPAPLAVPGQRRAPHLALPARPAPQPARPAGGVSPT